MLKNPIIQRYRYSLLRPKQFWMYQIIYFCVIGLIVLINTLFYFNSNKSSSMLFRGMYYQIQAFEVLILWFWASYNVGMAIKNELIRKTYDFFKMMPVPATQKAIGILLGTNLVALLFGAYNLVLLILFGILGKVQFLLNTYIFLAILSIALLVNAASLLSSIRTGKKQAHSSTTSLILLGLIISPVLIGGVVSLSESKLLISSIRFYFLSIPAPLMIALTSIYFFCWSFIGIIRKFNFERRPLFTYGGALWFTAGFSILVSGFYWPYMRVDWIPDLYSLWLITLAPLIIVPFGAARTYDMYFEGLRLSDVKVQVNNILWRLIKDTNLFLWLSLFIVWMLFALGMGIKSGYSLGPVLSPIPLIFSFMLSFAMLFELHTLYQPQYTKIKWLLVLITIIYIILPFILSAALEKEGLLLFSPVGYFSRLLIESFDGKNMEFTTTVFVLNLLLCVIPAVLIWYKYRQMLNIRHHLDS